MTATKEWFSVDRKGLAQLLERKGRAFAVLELVSNSWDTDSTNVDVSIEAIPDRRAMYELVVVDDDPNGFSSLAHAFTLFAPSNKKDEAEKRGRFNLGEKLVLALCETATITSTTGSVRFTTEGRSILKAKRDRGSEFKAIVKLTKPDVADIERLMRTLLPPPGVTTTYNGETMPQRTPAYEFKMTLPSELADEEGNMRPTARKTMVKLYEPLPGEEPTIYEMGIPVVENGDRWHYDIGQKIPLNMDRDNVKPAYLRQLRTAVLNHTFEAITQADANSTWTKEAIEDPRVEEPAIAAVIEKKFGEKVVSYDLSDPEANNIAVSQGYTVVHGRSLSKETWNNVRQHELIKPAGQVTPSSTALLNKHLQDVEEGGEKDTTVPDEKITPEQRRIMEYARLFGQQLLNIDVEVILVCDVTANASAWYGGRKLTLNLGRLSKAWFIDYDQNRVDALFIHEFAHHRAPNHLDHSFHDETCRLGALLRDVATRIEDIPVELPATAKDLVDA